MRTDRSGRETVARMIVVPRYLLLVFFAICVGSVLPTSGTAGETFTDTSALGTTATPSGFSALGTSLYMEQRDAVPLGNQIDTETLRLLKANPLPVPNLGPMYLEDESALMQTQPSAPTPSVNFQGITQPSPGITQMFSVPPDNAVAAGSNHVIQMVNTSWRVFSKTGTPTTTLTPFCGTGGWWSGVLPSDMTHCFDPKIVYDHFSDRWVMLAVARRLNPQSSRYLLMFKTSWK